MPECANTMKKEDFRQSYNTYWIVSSPSFMSSITQDMKYCQSLRSYDPKYGVDRADCKAIKALLYLPSPDVLIAPRQHIQDELKLIADMYR